MPPMLMPLVGPKSVSGTQVGPPLAVKKLVVFQTPPLAPAAKTVLPEESEGSIARPVTRPAPPEAEPSSPPELVPIAAGPTAVQVPLEVAFDWPSVKRRKLAPMVSVPGSPNPVVGAGFAKLSVQPLMVPVRPVVELFWIVSTQVPWALAPAKADSGCCGL